MILQFIRKRLPDVVDIWPVYAITVFAIYGWTLLTYFRYLHYWLDFLNVEEIVAIFFYAMLADFVESLIVLALLLGLCIILPPRFFKGNFVVHGALIVICVFGSIFLYLSKYSDVNDITTIMPWSVATLVVTIALNFILPKIRVVSRAATWLSDSMTVFLYFYLPLTFVSLIVIIIRNLI